jgi:hypothetical protein
MSFTCPVFKQIYEMWCYCSTVLQNEINSIQNKWTHVDKQLLFLNLYLSYILQEMAIGVTVSSIYW